MFVFALARLFTAIWLQVWLDAGDGRMAERMQNASIANVSLSDEEKKGFMTDNPDLWFYQVRCFFFLTFDILQSINFLI
jgi:hypothetical protein